MNPTILILGLHRVGYPPTNATIRGLFVSPRLLSFEIRLLKLLGYRFATLRDALLNPNEKCAVITFDDGYEDNFTHGLPVLERHGVPATIFIVTGDVGRKDVVWDEAGEKLPADMLTWSMLAELQARGWEIGSHGDRHEHLDRREYTEQQISVCHSVCAIEDRLGTVPISFAYPYGAFNENTKKTLRQFGLRFAVTTIAPGPHDQQVDLLELRRVPIGGCRFYHYLRCLVRTLKAAGIGEAISSLLPAGSRRGLTEDSPERNTTSF
jgi:peptidoglycan/xylan/chitin deacetylase (PgdA/CDA1 family)